MDPVVAPGQDLGENVLLPQPTLQLLLCFPDMLQWPWSAPAGQGVGGKKGGLECVGGGEHRGWESVTKRKKRGYQN